MPTHISVVSPDFRDQLIADAKSLPDLVNKAQTFDPPLAAALTQQASMASATPLGAFLAAGAAWLAAHYGLGWGETFDNLVAGGAIVVGGYLAHWWQAQQAPAPIFVPPPAPVPAPPSP
jgi:hypothetical protein